MSRAAAASRRHTARAEAAVHRGAPALWARTTPHLIRWLRRTLARLHPYLEHLVVEARAIAPQNPEILYITNLIQQLAPTAEIPEDLIDAVAWLPDEATLQSGFLASDPRRALITRETRRLLEGDLLAYWRTLTDPARLARRISAHRADGLTGQALTARLATEYRADYYGAERLVRTAYTGAANLAHVRDLEASGYTHKVWLTCRDARVRRGGRRAFDHVHMDRQTVLIHDPFVTPEGHRLMFPGDRSLGAPAGTLINCRCTVIGLALNQPQKPGKS